MGRENSLHIARRQVDEQEGMTPEQIEDRAWKAYDTLWGFAQSAPDPHARATLYEHINWLLGTSLLTIPSYTKERAETADLKTTSPTYSGDVSIASSTTPSGKPPGATSRDPSYSPADEDTGHR